LNSESTPGANAPFSPDDTLRHSLLHRIMVFFHAPLTWPAGLVALVAAALAAMAAAVWWATAGVPVAWWAGGALVFFGLVDILVLLALPRLRLSFGPWKPQFFVLLVARVAVAALLGVLALWLAARSALLMLLIVQVMGSLLLVWGAAIEPFRLGLSRLEVTTAKWPVGERPARILHITDLHIERLTRREARILDWVEALRPDLIVLTGDYLNLSYNEDATAHDELRDFLSRLQAPAGVYATLGSPPVDLRQVSAGLFTGLDIRLLRDEAVEVPVGATGRLVLLGLDCSHDRPTDAARLARVVAAAPDSGPRILLYHSPDLMPEASELGIELYLCGHTHGGQVRLPLFGAILTSSELGKRHEMGHYQIGQTHLYVSRGVGFEGLSAPRVRLLSPPEVTLVTVGNRPVSPGE
jgi:predicted MPP superfamily phosphohydrolase